MLARRLLSIASSLLLGWATFRAATRAAEAPKVFLAHYRAGYATRAASGQWGSLWTRGRVDPDQLSWEGQRPVAANDAPLIGPYDSADDAALECQVLLMKLAGLDGVIVGWPGLEAGEAGARIQRDIGRLVPWLKKAGLRFAICHGIPSARGRGGGSDWPTMVRDTSWAEAHWFNDPAYVRWEGRPVVLVSGRQDLDWRSGLKTRPWVFAHPGRSDPHGVDGYFAWPPVDGGGEVSPEQWRRGLALLDEHSKPVIPVVFPGFKEVSEGTGTPLGSIAPRGGATLSETLEAALKGSSALVGVATWNDYGEGTVIEPTRGDGYRRLARLQQARHAGSEADLRLPVLLHQLRRRGGDAAALDRAAALLFSGKPREAEPALEAVGAELGRGPATFAETPDAHDANYRLVTEILYRDGKDLTEAMRQRCRLDVYVPVGKGPFSTVVWFHGGGLTQGERSIPMPLRNRGVGVVAVNYRLAPEARSPAFIEDAAAAVAWTLRHIAEFGGSPDRVFVSGHSAGAYLSLMVGLDKRWLQREGLDADRIAGLIPLSPQVITHYAIREERGIADTQPVVDELAPLHHVRRDAPPMLLVTGAREKELLGRYEENAYFWRMLKLKGHPDVALHELSGYDHGSMAEPAFPMLLRFVREHAGRAPSERPAQGTGSQR